MENKIYNKFKKFLDSALFTLNEVNEDYIVFNYSNFYDSYVEYSEQLQTETEFIKTDILPFIRNELSFEGSIWIADYVYEK